MSDFQAFIDKERARLMQEREELTSQKAALETKLHDIEHELAAISAYETVKQGRLPEAKSPRVPRATREERPETANTRAPRGSKRNELLDLIRENPGMSRGEILAALKIVEKDNKAAAQSVSNALASLKKVGTLTNEGGKYQIAPA
jgi:hypothetical protein